MINLSRAFANTLSVNGNDNAFIGVNFVNMACSSNASNKMDVSINAENNVGKSKKLAYQYFLKIYAEDEILAHASWNLGMI